MTDQTDKTGESTPDLARAGIAESELTAGRMVVGHVADDKVLLARVGNEVLAIDATCTHYGGPLGDGLLVGDTVRCPWHHACFRLRSGEALAAPALTPVSCWRIEHTNGRLFVRERAAASAKHPTRAVGADGCAGGRIVIVGGGAAGFAAAEELRREGCGAQITLLSADAAAPYDRPNLSKDYLAGSAREEWIPLRPSSFYAETGIDLRLETRAVGVDLHTHRVMLDKGGSVDFDQLLLATGAEPVRLAIPGANLPHVLTLRSLADCRRVIERAARGSRAVIVGASFIGLEAAAALRHREVEVHVVAPEARPMERVLGPALGDFIRSLHEGHGVDGFIPWSERVKHFELSRQGFAEKTGRVEYLLIERRRLIVCVAGIHRRDDERLHIGAGVLEEEEGAWTGLDQLPVRVRRQEARGSSTFARPGDEQGRFVPQDLSDDAPVDRIIPPNARSDAQATCPKPLGDPLEPLLPTRDQLLDIRLSVDGREVARMRHAGIERAVEELELRIERCHDPSHLLRLDQADVIGRWDCEHDSPERFGFPHAHSACPEACRPRGGNGLGPRKEMIRATVDLESIAEAVDQVRHDRHTGFETHLLKRNDIGEGLEEIWVAGRAHAPQRAGRLPQCWLRLGAALRSRGVKIEPQHLLHDVRRVCPMSRRCIDARDGQCNLGRVHSPQVLHFEEHRPAGHSDRAPVALPIPAVDEIPGATLQYTNRRFEVKGGSHGQSHIYRPCCTRRARRLFTSCSAMREESIAPYLRETADACNDHIESDFEVTIE